VLERVSRPLGDVEAEADEETDVPEVDEEENGTSAAFEADAERAPERVARPGVEPEVEIEAEDEEAIFADCDREPKMSE